MSRAAALCPALCLAFSLAPAAAAGAGAAGEDGVAIGHPYNLSPHYRPGDRFGDIRLLGALELGPAVVEGQRLGGLSALAWDEDEGRLYALSDSGRLFHLRPEIDGDRLTGVRALAAFVLRDARGRGIRDQDERDAEGMAALAARNGRKGDTRLAIAFERHVRVAEHDPAGRYLGALALPPALAEARYSAANQALESLTEHPELGLLTAPERALSGSRETDRVSIYSLAGMRWDYPLREAPSAALVELAALPDGTLISLERAHGQMYLPFITSLRRSRPTAAGDGTTLAVETLAAMDTSQGWSVDNFEGLAWHRGTRFFMVSDDNFSQVQRTLLVYLEVLPGDGSGGADKVREFEPHHETRD